MNKAHQSFSDPPSTTMIPVVGSRRTMILLLRWLTLIALASSASCGGWDGIVVSESDHQGLLAFKQALYDPRGYLRSWNNSGGRDACSGAWSGVKCAKGKVISIQLPWRGLGGKITESIGQLSALRKLSLHDNDIGGQIPSGIGFLGGLRGVYLFNNRLSGEIPPTIGNCTLMQAIDFRNNALSGSIPISISSSTKLYRLDLGSNNLSGKIPAAVADSASIAFLSLRSNNLSGPIPDELGALSSLGTLDLSDNFLNGTLPGSIFNLPSLTLLDISGNLIGGAIPPAIGNTTKLSALDMSDNMLVGEVPASIDSLINLKRFNVSDNKLSGPVPPLLAERFNTSSFRGNIQLCGFSPSAPCPSPPPSHSASSNPSPSPSSPTKHHRRRHATWVIILMAAGISLVVLILLCLLLLFCFIRRRKTFGTKAAMSGAEAERGEKPTGAAAAEAESGGGDVGGKLVHFDGTVAFTADDLLCATAEVMGKSTYGTIYKATLEDGNQVAVKRLREKTAKGQKDFEAEIMALGKIRHPNLLALRAFYIGTKTEKLLVFDYMPKGSLAAFLHARAPDTPIDWPTRRNIVIGVARGLHYLHAEANMIHGNLTSSNILLDENADARISDYGISRLMTAAANSSAITTAGALGYRAPELSKLKKATTKTDVYSFGVVILELLTGNSPGESVNGVDLPQWVASIVKEEWTNEVFDAELMRDASESGSSDELLNTLKLALHCVDPSPAERPEVRQVLQQMEEYRPEELAAGEEADGGSKSGGGGDY